MARRLPSPSLRSKQQKLLFFVLLPRLWKEMLIFKVYRKRQGGHSRILHSLLQPGQTGLVFAVSGASPSSHRWPQHAHFLCGFTPHCYKARLCAIYKTTRGNEKEIRRTIKNPMLMSAGKLINNSSLWIPSISFQILAGLELKTADESCGFILFLTFSGRAKCSSPCLNYCKWVLPHKRRPPRRSAAARPRRAPPRSTGPWTRHSKPPFSHFPMRPGASRLYWSF